MSRRIQRRKHQAMNARRRLRNKMVRWFTEMFNARLDNGVIALMGPLRYSDKDLQ